MAPFTNNAESVFRASRISPSGLGLCTHEQMQGQGFQDQKRQSFTALLTEDIVVLPRIHFAQQFAASDSVFIAPGAFHVHGTP